MAEKLNLNLDRELQLLEEELEENGKIYDQIKDHYDRIMNSRSSGALKFVTDQTGNVLKVRSDRIGIVKEMIGVKKLKAEMTIKEMNLNKDEGGDGQINKVAKELYAMMKSDTRAGNITNLLSKNSESKEESESDEVKEKVKNEENLLEERMRIIQAKKDKERKEKEIKDRGYIFACDLNKNIYAIDETGTDIVEGVEIPDFDIEFLIDDLTGLTIAKNQYGDIIDIVEISEVEL